MAYDPNYYPLTRNNMSFVNWSQWMDAISILYTWTNDSDEEKAAQSLLNVKNFNHCKGIVFW